MNDVCPKLDLDTRAMAADSIIIGIRVEDSSKYLILCYIQLDISIEMPTRSAEFGMAMTQ